MTAGRPKLEIPRQKQINIKLSDFEFNELCEVAKKLKITKTEAIIRGIKLLKNPPQQIITRSMLPNFKPKKIPKHSEGSVEGETKMF